MKNPLSREKEQGQEGFWKELQTSLGGMAAADLWLIIYRGLYLFRVICQKGW